MMGYPANRRIVPAPRIAKQPMLATPLAVKIVPPPYTSALLPLLHDADDG
jgi:hypothetical protein